MVITVTISEEPMNLKG